MPTLLISHPACLEHLTPAGHPERPDRLRAIEQALEAEKFQPLARKQDGIGGAAIVDFDGHHGNGSQEIFWGDKSVMYCSTHQMPLFPGSGAVIESGEHNTVVNAPLRPGDGGDAFRAAFESRILPRLREFRPELVIISAGFDAHMRDPLASINLTEDDFVWVTQKIMDVADQSAAGRIVSLLEGAYDLRALASSVSAHVTTLMRG